MGEIYSSQPGRAERLKEVTLERNGRKWAATIEHFWHHDGRPVFKFVGVDSISAAEPWAGADILVSESERVEVEPGEYSHADLIGCKVIGCQVIGSSLIGVVQGVEDYGGPPTLRVEAVDGHEILVPFARAICREIDVAAKFIRVELPEGLTDL